MFVRITNTPRPYAWGSTSLIPGLLGTRPTGEPEAELWLGAHPGSPARIQRPALAGGARDLAEWVAAEPHLTLGKYAASGRLPFLLKILAAAAPLSLQAHPTPAQAREGFARENALGIPLDSPNRNYKDDYAKPELIFALTTFDALCGFRSVDSVRQIVSALLDADAARADQQPQPLEDLLASLDGEDAPRTTFEWLLSNGTGVPTLISVIVELAPLVSGFELEMGTVISLASEYPGDPGIVISLLLNRVRLQAGEALYLPAGNIHAYLAGLGVELMAASDNVLRGGLTPKHIDIPELLSVLDFRTQPVPFLTPVEGPGVEVFRPDVPDFVLVRVSAETTYPVDGPAIAICTDGSFGIAGAHDRVELGRGESVYITPDEGTLTFRGRGVLFLATTGR